MDISTCSGLKKFVTLLVHWSFCGSERLGYDPTMVWNRKTHKLEITCTSQGNKNSGKSRSRSSEARCLEGTRCYLARRKGGRGKSEVVLKDSWPLSRDISENETFASDPLDEEQSYIAADAPDKAHNLRLIAEKLAGIKLNSLYPKAESSGNVILSGGIADNTHAIFNFDKNEEKNKLFRVHRRIVMSPVGNYLNTVQNEEELVFVVADAMKCHNAILTECRLLHRDISVNNILLVREFKDRSVRRPVRGLLIDFDHVISIDKESSGYATRLGTLPFMISTIGSRCYTLFAGRPPLASTMPIVRMSRPIK
ncbi:hypothetical protein IWW48_006137 [Coemansia sp. RSA 1200]|nr:hypothetical protein IWW48_006137 [Coemansia sp. RSA 1200]